MGMGQEGKEKGGRLMKFEFECGAHVGSGIVVLPAIYWGRSDSSWWIYVIFLRGRFGVRRIVR